MPLTPKEETAARRGVPVASQGVAVVSSCTGPFDRVAEGGPGAVGLDGVDVRGAEPGVVQGVPDHALLGGSAGGGEAVGGAVLVDGRPAYDGQHLVAVAFGVRQPFHDEDTDALAPPHAVRRGTERLAAPVGRQPTLTAELHERRRTAHDRRTTGERQIALALTQGTHRQVEGHQGGRAGRVHGQGRALQTEGVRHPAGRHTGRPAGGGVPLQVARHVLRAIGVVLQREAGEDTRTGTAQPGRVDTGPFHRFPGDLQQQPLLRIHGERFPGADAEERGVEPGRVREESAFPGVRRAGVVRVGMVQPGQVPAAVGGERGNRVASVAHQLPEVFGRGDGAGETAAHADDHHRVVRRAVHRGGGPAGRAAEGSGAAGQPVHQVRGQGQGRGVVEGQGRGQGESGGGGEPVAQLDRAHRGQPGVAERPPRVEGRRPRTAVGRVTAGRTGAGTAQHLGAGVRHQAQHLVVGGDRGDVRRVARVPGPDVAHVGRAPWPGRYGIRSGVRGLGGPLPHVGEPVPPTLEGVRRQVGVRRLGQYRRPVDPAAAYMRPCHRREQGDHFGPVPAHHRYGERVAVRQALLGHRRQHAVRAQLQERTGLVALQLPYGVQEPHR